MRATSTSIKGPRHARRARTGGKRATITIAAAIGAGILVALLAGTSQQASDMAGITSITTATTIRPSSDPTINVTGNAQLAAVADRGSGTPADPYVIENRVIDGGFLVPTIYIDGTNASLVIRNCTVFNSFDYDGDNVWEGIQIFSCSNVTLIDNDFSHFTVGIRISDCTNMTLVNNVIGAGLAFFESKTITVNKNRAFFLFGDDIINCSLWENSIHQTYLMRFTGNGNKFDNGTHGNYWVEYQLRYPNATHDGVTWDTPYTFYQNNSDNHPLVHDPFAVPVVDPWQVAFGITAAAAGGVIAGLAVVVARLKRQITGRTP